MAMNSVNNASGSDGLVPALFVFGALPGIGISTDISLPSTQKHAIALSKARTAIYNHFSSRKVWTVPKSCNSSEVTGVHFTLICAQVLVYRPEKDNYDGSCLLPKVYSDDVTLLTAKEPETFHTTAVRSFFVPPLKALDEQMK